MPYIEPHPTDAHLERRLIYLFYNNAFFWLNTMTPVRNVRLRRRTFNSFFSSLSTDCVLDYLSLCWDGRDWINRRQTVDTFFLFLSPGPGGSIHHTQKWINISLSWKGQKIYCCFTHTHTAEFRSSIRISFDMILLFVCSQTASREKGGGWLGSEKNIYRFFVVGCIVKGQVLFVRRLRTHQLSLHHLYFFFVLPKTFFFFSL